MTAHRPQGLGVARRWAPYAAALWSFGYGAVALVWTVTGSGFPLGENDPDGSISLLAGMPAAVGAPLFAAVALAGAVVAMAMVRTTRMARSAVEVPLRWRRAAVGFGAITAAWWLLVVPDARVLALAGYLPILVVRAPFDAELRAQLGEALSAAYLNHAAALVGGFLWVLATVTFVRSTGRPQDGSAPAGHWTIPASAARWGRVAVSVAVAVPVLYAITRWSWVAGIPLGISEEFHARGMASGELWSGAWLASFGLVGAALTLGLVQRWGEVFPRWLPWLGGRAVPIRLAVIPAWIVSALVFSGGLGLSRAAIADGRMTAERWAEIGPVLLWPLWGVALAAAALAYYLRRRPVQKPFDGTPHPREGQP